jgi:hypothetical protein
MRVTRCEAHLTGRSNVVLSDPRVTVYRHVGRDVGTGRASTPMIDARSASAQADAVDPHVVDQSGLQAGIRIAAASRAIQHAGRMRHFVDGANAMHFVVSLGLILALCESADAATVHHSNPRGHASVRHAFGAVRPFAARPSQAVSTPGFAVPGWTDDATRRWMDRDTIYP